MKDQEDNQARIRRIAHYSGFVQGVGFRYTACRVAGQFDVAGYVKNLSDGSVEVVAEGMAREVDLFLKDLHRQMARYIRTAACHEGFPTGEWLDFHVEYY
jgi:acylphosphatase